MLRNEWLAHLDGLVVFRGLLAAEPLRSLHAALAADEDALTGAVAAFEAALFARGTNWTEALLDAVLEEENLCLRVAAGQDAGPVLETALNSELDFLQTLGRAPLDEVFPGAAMFLPRWETTPDADYHAAYEARRAAMGQKGYGMFARHHVFALEDGHLVPVRYPDPQRLSELPGYEQEREKVIANTRALLEGRPANNVLLYGDAGTGKSSTVKAIANEFAPDGLRLIEVKKNQLYQIPALMDELAKNPLKFILFIDDLSFASNDDNFAALKAILEGGVGGRSHNVAVYATSNRRHLVKETMTDRSGDDLHAMDTRQELMSLSARFGLTVTFQQPDKDRYDRILLELAKQLHCKKEVILGYRDVLFLNEEFAPYGEVVLATEDGSAGTKGNVIDAIREHGLKADVIFACGPTPMLRALKAYAAEESITCFLSLEEKMACGIGACLACVCKTKNVDEHSQVHNARICKDGPVFRAEEVEL